MFYLSKLYTWYDVSVKNEQFYIYKNCKYLNFDTGLLHFDTGLLQDHTQPYFSNDKEGLIARFW